jgi:hypothetical protein
MGLMGSADSLASTLEEIVIALLLITIILSLFLQMLLRYILNLLFDAIGVLQKHAWKYIRMNYELNHIEILKEDRMSEKNIIIKR